MRAVVGGIQDNRLVGDPGIVDGLEHLSNVPVMFDHAVRVFGPGGQARLAAPLGGNVGAEVHPCAVVPAEK